MWFLRPGIGFEDILMRIVAVMIIVFLVMPLHECAHGWIAVKLGDNTAKYSGRLTLNPLPHIDPLGALAILLFGFGWARPVPVDPRNFKNPKSGMALTALAGPLSNLLAALVGGLVLKVIFMFSASIPAVLMSWILIFFINYMMINVGLAVFNLVPLPPLDGSKIIGAFIPDRILYRFAQYQNIIMMIVFVLLFVGVLSVPLGILQIAAYNGIIHITGLPSQMLL